MKKIIINGKEYTDFSEIPPEEMKKVQEQMSKFNIDPKNINVKEIMSLVGKLGGFGALGGFGISSIVKMLSDSSSKTPKKDDDPVNMKEAQKLTNIASKTPQMPTVSKEDSPMDFFKTMANQPTIEKPIIPAASDTVQKGGDGLRILLALGALGFILFWILSGFPGF